MIGTRLLSRLFAASCLLQAVCAWAQIEASTSEYIACMTPTGEARNDLRYPPDVLRDGISGTTTVEMEFSLPDVAPEVKVVAGTEKRLNEFVTEHVRSYRVPCLPSGKKARFRQQFVFVPNPHGQVSWTDPVDEDESKYVACVTHVHPGTKPEWPNRSPKRTIGRRGMAQGVVLARIRFTSNDGPPEITTPETPLDASFADSVREWARDYRLPCYDGHPVEAMQLFRFRYDDFPSTPLPTDTTLLDFLSAVNLEGQRRYFELDRMSCPFQIRFQYGQPLMRNRVGEIGDHIEARQPLLDWFAALRFNTKPTTENLLLGESMTISVPCGKIDL